MTPADDKDREPDDVETGAEAEVEETPAAEPVESDEPAESDESAKESRLPQLLLTGVVALVVAAAVVAGWFAVSWFRAANDDSVSYSRTRDEVNRVGQAAVVTMNTLDYRTIDQGLKDWETATTGKLQDEVKNLQAQSKQTILQVESVTKATVQSSAVTELDERAGRAVILVALKVNVAVKGEQPTDKFLRIEASLQRTEAGWKLDGIGHVPTTQTGP